MREAVVGVYHHDCWGSRSTERFPLVSMREAGSVSIIKKSEKGVLVGTAFRLEAPNEQELNKYLDHLRGLGSIKSLEVMARTGKTALFVIKFLSPTSSYDTVLGTRCIHIAPIVQEGGFEIHPVICDRPGDVTKLLGELEQIGEVKIFRIGRHREKANRSKLTEKQLEALKTALNHGYYSWPRKITLEELSGTIGAKRRAFHENLRKAEAKVFPGMLKGVMYEAA
jgi:predicted DNA binding protein